MKHIAAVLSILCLCAAPGAEEPSSYAPLPISFSTARPIWPERRETEMNLFVGFRAAFAVPEGTSAQLRLAASTVYRAFLNSQFLGHGPARGPHGYYRVDQWDLGGLLRPGRNVIAIEVAGYNVNSYALLDQPSFLQAEVTSGGRVLASTAGDGALFEAAVLPYRVQKVARYSFQRTFTEVYRASPGFDSWRSGVTGAFAPLKCSMQPEKKLLQRGVPYPRFALRGVASGSGSGRMVSSAAPEKLWKDRSMTGVGQKFKGFAETELVTTPSLEIQRMKSVPDPAPRVMRAADSEIRLASGAYQILDFGNNLTGFIGARIRCVAPVRLWMTFDELLTAGEVDFKRLGCINLIAWDLAPGEYDVESFEPYTLRFLKLIALDGECLVNSVHLRELANPDVYESEFVTSDRGLNRVFEAARETFRQNAVDIFMDCPSRERAGWLCDSYFTARVAFDLSGHLAIERNFLENFALPPMFGNQPEGMLPMCYPSDHYDGVFIPNWALWFVVQLEEYAARGGDRALVERLKPRVLALFNYLAKFRNSDGLLEKLPSWVFVEWSKANSFVQDVNYPSNMLYAGALDAAGRLYGLADLRAEAGRVRETIRRQSFDGNFFVDNAVRRDGRLQVTRNRTEVCQYYAFFFDVATRDLHRALWDRLQKDFGPKRKFTGRYAEIHPANAFVGNYLRLELLSRYGRQAQLLGEIKDYFLKMAETTGTLWENDNTSASCNHGFASHVAHVLVRDVLGVQNVNPIARTVTLQLPDVPLNWCRGRIPIAGGFVEVEWWREGKQIRSRVSVPAGFRIQTR